MATPGMHPNINLANHSKEEIRIVENLSRELFITANIPILSLSERSVYRAFLGKPCPPFDQMFNLEREIIIIISNYEEFEVRTIDAFEAASERFPKLRTDPICRILVSKDPKICLKIKGVLKNDPELPVIIPFTNEELSNITNRNLIVERFREYFFSRDLFAFESPLKKDLYFFGRGDLINKIMSRHKSNENSGLFGLRRSGKTSIVYGLQRASRPNGMSFISIDCQSPSVHKRRWHELLRYIIDQLISSHSVKITPKLSREYSELDASEFFYEDIKSVYIFLERRPIIIAFDEIERISPKTGSSDHWCNGSDFVYFWQAVRSAFQRHTGIFSFSLIGTNPYCIETAKIDGHDNPIFNSVPIEYIPGFDAQQTKEMVVKLGLYIGLKFEDAVCAKLHDDFGGHPYLIRHVCSIINNNHKMPRPINIDKSVYTPSKEEFNKK